MVTLLFAAQILAADSTYATPALRELIGRASVRNRVAPAALLSYAAQVESEIAVIRRRPDGREGALSVEQSRSDVRWERSGEFDQHVTGYRAQNAGLTMSALAFLRRAWTVPVLYGNRLSLLFGLDSSVRAPRDDLEWGKPGVRGTLAVHPLSAGRDDVYRFRGGDTIATIRTGDRHIPLVRVLVEPRVEQRRWPVVVFRGEMDLDAVRGEIVRIRGYFITLGRRGPVPSRLAVVPLEVVAFVELESVEVEGRYWLPAFQRLEAQVAINALRDERSSFRIVSRFRGHRVSLAEPSTAHPMAIDGGAEADAPAVDDSIGLVPHRLSYASGDSLSREVTWWQPIGHAVSVLRSDDFMDIAPDHWRPGRATGVRFAPRRFSDLVRFNRVDGWSTGLAGEAHPRGVAPGVVVRGDLAWAWTASTVRGGMIAGRSSGLWTTTARVERRLDVTNDFGADSGGTLIHAIGSIDDFDYVDRRSVTVGAERVGGEGSTWSLRVGAGLGVDRQAPARLTRGILAPDSSFRPNRGVAPGSYGRTAITIESNSGMATDVVRDGIGARLRYERGDGTLDWQRAELRVDVRQRRGARSQALRIDAGMMRSGAPLPQQLFEVGAREGLRGYEYKAFAGDEVVLLRWRGMQDLPVLRAPLRLFGCPCLSALAPAFAIGLQTASVRMATDNARRGVAMLGSTADVVGAPPLAPGTGTAVSRATDGWRTSVEIGLRFFGGSVGVGFARPLDRAAAWRPTLSLGREF
jgi:hypothetical protein